MDIYPTPVGEVHGPGYPVFPHKLQTGPWQSFGGTTTHQFLPLDETAPKDRGSRSRWDRIFKIPYFKEFCLSRPKFFSKNRPKIIKKKFAGLHPAPSLYGAAPLPPTKVSAKCLAAVVLDNPDRALCQCHPSLKWYAVTYMQILQCTLMICVVFTCGHSFNALRHCDPFLKWYAVMCKQILQCTPSMSYTHTDIHLTPGSPFSEAIYSYV